MHICSSGAHQSDRRSGEISDVGNLFRTIWFGSWQVMCCNCAYAGGRRFDTHNDNTQALERRPSTSVLNAWKPCDRSGRDARSDADETKQNVTYRKLRLFKYEDSYSQLFEASFAQNPSLGISPTAW